jgi:hypothetical protein
MKTFLSVGALAAVLAAFVLAPAPAPAEISRQPNTVALCSVPSSEPQMERTVHVPPADADRLVRTTLSYRGACASYGESAPLGDGAVTAYSQADHDVPSAIGLVLRSRTLDGLPYHPPTAGLWCFDHNGDGTVDPMLECMGGYENALYLSDRYRKTVDTPFTYLLVNWNPRGHTPPGIYDVAHFDVHFYLNDNAERLKIRPGPCTELLNCDDYKLGKVLPAPRYIPADHKDVDALLPAMGNHLIDLTAAEFHGQPFTHTFIYGSWNGNMTFYEPMVTHQWFSSLVAGTRSDACFPLKLPQAWQRSGWYPNEYCLRYRENRHELIVSLERFAYRHAS